MSKDKKLIESRIYLEDGDPASLRDRAMSLCATWSVSRSSECGAWEICDLFRFVYPATTEDPLGSPLETLYAIQLESKTRSVSLLFISIIFGARTSRRCSDRTMHTRIGMRSAAIAMHC